MTWVIGVDPGKFGAIAVVSPEGIGTVRPIPLVTAPRGRDEFDLPGIIRLLRDAREDEHNGLQRDVIAFLERGQPLPPKMGGGVANYHRGFSRGLFEGIFTVLGMAYELVPPQRWQKIMLAGTSGADTKQRSIIAAQRMFPLVDLAHTPRARKPSDGMSDALLIAGYGRRLVAGGSLFAGRAIA